MRKIHINNDDNYATPPQLLKALHERFNFDFDPCPYCEGDPVLDGLSIEWGQSNFINPPYSRKLKEAFVLKGIEESKKGKLCVFLIPVSTSTKLFHDHIKPNATSIEFLRGRVKFGKLDGSGEFVTSGKAGTKDSMLVVFDGRVKGCSFTEGELIDKKAICDCGEVDNFSSYFNIGNFAQSAECNKCKKRYLLENNKYYLI
jgi:hypothetical protein